MKVILAISRKGEKKNFSNKKLCEVNVCKHE